MGTRRFLGGQVGKVNTILLRGTRRFLSGQVGKVNTILLRIHVHAPTLVIRGQVGQVNTGSLVDR